MMKNFTSLTIVMLLSLCTAIAQVPSAFNYQAVVRNSSGELITNQNVSFKISILEDSDSGTAVYSETHAATTNNYGLANLKVGDGTIESGTFNPADWGTSPHFIKIEMDAEGGSSFTHMGTSQLLSVPYAFHAQTVAVDNVDDADADASNELQTISLNGTQLTLSDGGGTVTLPSTGGGDDWGTQTVVSDATLSGNGTSTSPLGVDGDLTDDQILSLSGNNLSISDGNTVTLPNLWTASSSDIYYNTGKVFIGKSPDGSGTELYVDATTGNHAIIAQSQSAVATIYAKNLGTGPAGDFRNYLRILDGTQGAGKVLTSDANGLTSWETPSSSPWTQEGDNIKFGSGKVATDILDLDAFQDFQVIKEGEVGVLFKSQASGASLQIERPNTTYSCQLMFANNGDRQYRVGMLHSKTSFMISTESYTLNGLEIEPDGDVNLSDELHSTNTGDANMMPFAYGYVTSAGSLSFGTSNVGSVSKLGTGQYKVMVDDLGANYVVQLTGVSGSSYYLAKQMGMATTYFSVSTWDTKNDAYVDCSFSFVVYKL